MVVEIPPELEREIEKAAERARMSDDGWVRQSLDKTARVSAVERMTKLNAPTCDIEQMLAEIDAGRLECFRDLEDLP